MSYDVAVRATGLSKQYRVGERVQYRTLYESIGKSVANLARPRRRERTEKNSMWALRDLNFEFRRGCVTGVVGRNGSGKTTLLKILSRVTKPTSGNAEIHGHVGSLLEVGTGFHPELTGRDNVYLAGAIHGMSKRVLDRKFEEIVDFSGVERHIDTPLKRYSTGMQMRLAFAVAAHMEPEILLVDEVLAVGDLAFQKKCIGKMEQVAGTGRTILFVSHHMAQVRRLCQEVVWLEGGRLRASGPAAATAAAYEIAQNTVTSDDAREESHGEAHWKSWAMVGAEPGRHHVLDTLGPASVTFGLQVNRAIPRAHHGLALLNADRQRVWSVAFDDMHFEPGMQHITYSFPTLPVRPGAYTWHASLHGDEGLIDEWHCVPELIVDTIDHGHRMDQFRGILNLPYEIGVSLE